MARQSACNAPKGRPESPDDREGRSTGWPHWALGVVLCLSALPVFGWNARAATAGGLPTPSDQAVADWFHGHRVAGLTPWMRLATGLASTAWVTGITLVIALGMVWKHAWHRLFVLALIVPGGMAVSSFLKLLFHRPRPIVGDALPILAGYSFPSGHTMAATLLYGGLVCLAWSEIRARSWRMGTVLGAFVLVPLVGLSRVQLDAHYLSDHRSKATGVCARLRMPGRASPHSGLPDGRHNRSV